MASFNKVVLIGRLTRDPEVKFTQSGTAVCKFGLAVDRAMSKTKETDFINITAWSKLAEVCGKYLVKGKLVMIEGSIKTDKYEDKQGNKRTSFDVNAQNMQMLDSKGGGGGGSDSGGYGKSNYNEPQDAYDFDAEDMPF